MTATSRCSTFFALLLGFAVAVHAAPADTPASYAARWSLQLPADASLVRLPLPVEVLTQAQTADLRDLRVFNADGLPVPLTLDRYNPENRVPALAALPITLPVLPILGEAQPGNASGGMALRIEENTNERVVRLDLPPANAAREKVLPEALPVPLAGMLVDTRTQADALEGIELDATWPAARPFTFRLHTSTDLRNWHSLGEVTTYRSGEDENAVSTPALVKLAGVSLQARYLRVTWDSVATPEAVQIRAVRLLPVARETAPPRLAVPLILPDAGRDPHVLEWRLPFAVPVVALDIRVDSTATLVPVRVLVRQQREQPWKLLARHVVFNLTQDGRTQHSLALELGQAAWREWRIEAEATSPGFPTTPQIIALLAPAQLVFMASGQPPFTLVVGRTDAPAVSLPMSTLIPGYEPGVQARLPVATLIAASADTAGATAPINTTVPGAEHDRRKWILWSVLLSAVLALSGMAWVLMRQLNRGTADSGIPDS